MEPQNLRFGGGIGVTLLHPLVAVAILLAIVLILFLPRKHIIVPILLSIFFIPKGQVVVLAQAHFTAAKILFLAGLIRWATSRRSQSGWFAGSFNSVDRLFIALALLNTIVFSVQWMEIQALIKSLGDLLDMLGGYFVLRFAIQDNKDVKRTVKILALIAIVSAACMINEQLTGSNIFGRLGGIPETIVRDGKIRSQAAFEVFITAGAFGATLLPLLVWLWSDEKSRISGLLGMFGATVMTITCYASTTLVAYAAGIFSLCLWPLRRQMRLVRWGLLLTLVGLHLVMHGPVWSLIEKVDLTGSSSSYHRYMLIDNCIRHFGDWWLLGFKGYDTWGFDMWDLSNQYVAYAVSGGLATLVVFIALISRSFAGLGTARKLVAGNRKQEWFFWCLGSALFAHVVAYFGIGYFDQMEFAWLALLAIICAAVSETKRSPVPLAQVALAPAYPVAHFMDLDVLETKQ
ncbi:MAG: hypothetical protein LAO09_17625 [Acidobacteriia bacterium]|nr:hypothetical protein [Terriglobia bacterium]